MLSLEQDPIEVRNHFALTVCIDSKNIPEAKVRIHQFLWELTEFLAQGIPDRVYELNLGLFPLQSIQENKKQ